MPSSLRIKAIHLATLQPLTLKEQPKEYLSHLFVGRLLPKLGNCNRVRDFGELVDLFVVGKLKSYFHLVHRNDAGCTEAPAPVQHNALVGPLNMVVRRLFSKGLVRQISGAFKEGVCNVFVHPASVAKLCRYFHSYFPREL